MKENKRNVMIGIFLLLLCLTMISFSLTYARYSAEKRADGPASGDFEFVVANWFEVRNERELVAAVQNGYESIKISDDAEEPFIVTTGVSDVGADLVIDLNGKTLVRNSRAPLLNVKEGISLTVIDSSEEQSGAFYNPVGSTLRSEGGTLTVGSGSFESGPRADEYAKDLFSAVEVQVFERNQDNSGYTGQGTAAMPVIQEGVYFGNAPAGIANEYIAADTYLVYMWADCGEEIAVTASDADNADFYYRYFADENGAATEEASAVRQVIVFGYNEVKGITQNGNPRSFAAVEASGGEIRVRGGEYRSYFGTARSYAVYSSGGIMTVQENSNIAFSSVGQGVCVYCSESGAHSGGSSASLSISTGTFSSELGDTVHVSGGRLDLNGGEFYKDASAQAEEEIGGAAVRVTEGGSIGTTASADTPITFSITGSRAAGIMLDRSASGGSGSIVLPSAAFTFTGGQQNTGIVSRGGTLIVNGSLVINGGENTPLNGTAIYVDGGSVGLQGEVDIITSSAWTAAWQKEGVPSYDDIPLDYFYDGVYMTGGSLQAGSAFNASHNGADNEAQDNADNEAQYNNDGDAYQTFAIKSFAVRVENAVEVTLLRGKITNAVGGGLYVSGGNVTLGQEQNQEQNLNIITKGQDIYDNIGDNNGQINIGAANDNGTWDYKLSKTGGHAVEIVGGTLEIMNGSYTAAQGDGIKVSGGTVTIKDGTFSGADNYTIMEDNSSNAVIPTGPAASYALKMYGGTVTVSKGVFGKEASGSGIFITGTAEQEAKADIDQATIEVYGTSAISVYSNAEIYLGEKGQPNELLTLSGGTNGLAIEDLNNGLTEDLNNGLKEFGSSPSKVTIYSGSFTGGRDAIWYGGSATLEIQAGSFTGNGRSGLFFQIDPGTSVTLSGGTFTGQSGERSTSTNNVFYWRECGAIGATIVLGGFGNRYDGIEIEANAIIEENVITNVENIASAYVNNTYVISWNRTDPLASYTTITLE